MGRTAWIPLPFVILPILQAVSAGTGELCKDYGLQFERVFTVPGEGAMLNCSLAAPDVFDFHTIPYNISWYHRGTGLELPGATGPRAVVLNELLWFLNNKLEDTGEYTCVLRTPERCFKQHTLLIVNRTEEDECARPYKAPQIITLHVNNFLVCPLHSYIPDISQMENYTIRWYKGCELIPDAGRFSYVQEKELAISDVVEDDGGLYTCWVNFSLAGTVVTVSETIQCDVEGDYYMTPEMVEPTNSEVIKAPLGFPFSKKCRVFVVCVEDPMVNLFWERNGEFISTDRLDRIYHAPLNNTWVDEGVWLEQLLNFTMVEPEDFNQSYTCTAFNFRKVLHASFILQPTDPNRLPLIGLLMAGLVAVFTMCVVSYRLFKIDLVLWVRRVCPYLYKSTECDGKVYDAYVIYPHLYGDSSTQLGELFALHTLPQVLEGEFGYTLFIFGRDSVPGEAMVDVVQENMALSRRVLLLYTSSTFGRPEAALHFEQQMGAHAALLQGSLQVVLLELEEVSDTATLPESVRHLRETQGAVRCWRRSWWSRGPGEAPSLSPPPGFWKELRYHMPVRGRRLPCSEKLSFLTF